MQTSLRPHTPELAWASRYRQLLIRSFKDGFMLHEGGVRFTFHGANFLQGTTGEMRVPVGMFFN